VIVEAMDTRIVSFTETNEKRVGRDGHEVKIKLCELEICLIGIFPRVA